MISLTVFPIFEINFLVKFRINDIHFLVKLLISCRINLNCYCTQGKWGLVYSPVSSVCSKKNCHHVCIFLLINFLVCSITLWEMLYVSFSFCCIQKQSESLRPFLFCFLETRGWATGQFNFKLMYIDHSISLKNTFYSGGNHSGLWITW